MQDIDHIIPKLSSDTTIALSALASSALYERLLHEGHKVILIDTTLQGQMNPLALPKSYQESLTIIATDFFGIKPNIVKLQNIAQERRYNFFYIEHKQTLSPATAIYETAFASAKDFSFIKETQHNLFTLFLEPYLFCPKEEILSA